MNRPIRPSSGQLARTHGREPRPVVLPPVLHEYDTVIRGHPAHVKVYGKPPLDTPLPKPRKIPVMLNYGLDPDLINP